MQTNVFFVLFRFHRETGRRRARVLSCFATAANEKGRSCTHTHTHSAVRARTHAHAHYPLAVPIILTDQLHMLNPASTRLPLLTFSVCIY